MAKCRTWIASWFCLFSMHTFSQPLDNAARIDVLGGGGQQFIFNSIDKYVNGIDNTPTPTTIQIIYRDSSDVDDPVGDFWAVCFQALQGNVINENPVDPDLPLNVIEVAAVDGGGLAGETFPATPVAPLPLDGTLGRTLVTNNPLSGPLEPPPAVPQVTGNVTIFWYCGRSLSVLNNFFDDINPVVAGHYYVDVDITLQQAPCPP